MLKKLSEKKLINYTRYHGVSLTTNGKKTAGMIVRKHRLWELFLVEKLKYTWDEVHEIAEQLEHIQSESLVKKLSLFLGSPKFDPHGDPIPDENGNVVANSSAVLADISPDRKVTVSGVKDHSPEFLKFLGQLGIHTGSEILIREINEFDQSMAVRINGMKRRSYISKIVAKNILVTPLP
jgi:DtxR family transcriptional regulator, Mn-dependent transcriptional regulator